MVQAHQDVRRLLPAPAVVDGVVYSLSQEAALPMVVDDALLAKACSWARVMRESVTIFWNSRREEMEYLTTATYNESPWKGSTYRFITEVG